MKRDGALESLWQHGMEDYTARSANTGDRKCDILIAGGGLTGMLTGLLLQKAGRRCIIAEAHSIGFGTSGGTSAHLNNFFDTTYGQAEKDFGKENASLLAKGAAEALGMIKENIGRYKIDCDFEEKAAYLFSLDEKQDKALEDLVAAALEAGVQMDFINDSPFPIPYRKVAIAPGQGQFHPVKYLFALAAAFEEAGGIILTDTRVLKTGGDKLIKAETSAGAIECSALVWATHIPPGVNLLHFRAAPYRSYVMGFGLNNNEYPDALGYDLEDPYHYYRTHKIDGKNYLVAGGEDHKTAHEENTETCFRKLEAYVRQFYDVKEAAFKWSSQYFESADGLAYIGNLPGNAGNIYVATGYGGNGMIYSHIAARTIADMITTGKSEYRELFDPNRIKPMAGFTNFVKENADVVKNFIRGKFSAEKIEGLAELAAGEAKLSKYDGNKIALFKDEAHNIHAVNPTCTHVYCTVSWNSAERSWDCPCHGARYDADGKVLTGPATVDLERVDIVKD